LKEDGSRIADHDWRDDFDSDYIFLDGKRVLVLFTDENVNLFISLLKNGEAPQKREKGKPGPRLKFDEIDAKEFVFQQLADNGDFDKPDNQVEGWRSQNDLVGKLQDYMATPARGRETAIRQLG
jgi:hypothetical protein